MARVDGVAVLLLAPLWTDGQGFRCDGDAPQATGGRCLGPSYDDPLVSSGIHRSPLRALFAAEAPVCVCVDDD